MAGYCNYPVYAGFGAVGGFILFLCNLESSGMGNIIIRNGKFSPFNVIRFILSPFHQYFLWMPGLWASNWIIMTSTGFFTAIIIGSAINYIHSTNQ